MTELELFRVVCDVDIIAQGSRIDADSTYTMVKAAGRWEERVPTLRLKRIIRFLMREIADRAAEKAINQLDVTCGGRPGEETEDRI